MFSTGYKLFNFTLVGETLRTKVKFKKESDIYKFLRPKVRKLGWKYLRVDTTNQIGFPDVLLLKEKEYWQLEAKLLKKKELLNLEDDLKWQYGQIAYMTTALSRNLNYILVVAKETTITFIKGDHNVQCPDYPDFIRRL